LDYDNNIAIALAKISKVFLISSSLIGWIVFPQAAGALLTTSGTSIQSKLLTVLTSLALGRK